MGLFWRILQFRTAPAWTCDPQKIDGPLTMRERWVAAIPMFMLFTLVPAIIHASVNFELMYQDLDLGALPAATQALFSLRGFLIRAPWAMTAPMFAIAWSYFAWISKHRIWAQWFSGVTGALFFVGLFAAGVSLFLPLIENMERIK